MRIWSAVVVSATAVLALAACTSDEKPQGAGGGAPPGSAAAPDGLTHELQFVACMRQQGVADMPDPIPGDTSGRSAVRYALDAMGKGSDPAFQAALDKCVSLLPAAEADEPGSPDEVQRHMEFAACMRENGVPDFPDPYVDPDGKPLFRVMVPNPSGTGKAAALMTEDVADIPELFPSDPKLGAAVRACRSKLPAPDPTASAGTR